MNIKILFDKEAIDSTFLTGWGVSYLVGDQVLFDTGEKFEALLHNAEKLGVDLKTIPAVVISHDHWDHTGGLWELLSYNHQITVYSCPHFSDAFKKKVRDAGANLVELADKTRISGNIYSTGEILGVYKHSPLAEQSLVIEGPRALAIICGCAHPGILHIIHTVQGIFDKDARIVLGGLHLMDTEKRIIECMIEEFLRLGITLVGPSHCSGFEAISLFKERYQNNFLKVQTGGSLEIL